MPFFIFVALGIIGWGVWALSEKMALTRSSPWQTLFVSTVLKAFVALPLAATLLFKNSEASGFSIHQRVWMWMFIGALTNAIAITTFRFLLSRRGAGVTIALIETAPIATAFLAFIFLGEMLTPLQWMGIGTTVAGVALLSRG